MIHLLLVAICDGAVTRSLCFICPWYLRPMPKGQGKHCIKNPASIFRERGIQFLLLPPLNNLLYFIKRFPSSPSSSSQGSLGICPCKLLQSSFPDTKEYGAFTLSSIPLCWSLMFLCLTLSLALFFFFSFTYVLSVLSYSVMSDSTFFLFYGLLFSFQ